MGLMNKFNKGGVNFDISIDGFKFLNLKDLWGQLADNEKDHIFGVDGLYINKKSSFGDHPVAILGELGLLVDLPGHTTEEVTEILKDAEVVQAIKDGKVGFTIQQYQDKKFKKTCYGIHWEDIE